MAEPDHIEFHEHLGEPDGRQPGAVSRSVPVRIGIVAGSAILVVIGAVAAMGASPAPSGSTAAPDGGATPGTPLAPGPRIGPLGGFGFEFRGGGVKPGAFRDITIGAINGSNLSLKTDDGWTRTITVGSSTTIKKGGQTIGVGDLALGDQIVFAESKATDGSFTITTIRVVLPVVGGQVSAVTTDTITVTQPRGGSATIHVSVGTTFDIKGNADAKLSDITVGSFVVAEGSLRSDGSLDATAVHGGARGGPGALGRPGEPRFHGGPDGQGNPKANPTPTPTSPSSAG